ncbi:MAG: hypothetical protein J6O04_00725 [Selenomonadaceae bacterium]|nr:hypothetical protein [Selenomonadaceae bacterium]
MESKQEFMDEFMKMLYAGLSEETIAEAEKWPYKLKIKGLTEEEMERSLKSYEEFLNSDFGKEVLSW